METHVILLAACLVLASLNLALAAPMSEAEAYDQSESTMRSATGGGDATSMFISNNNNNNNISGASDNTSAIASQVSGYVKDSLHVINKTSTFTCFGREMGYYADTERDCRIYFFCMAGDYNGELVYQRISYLCLNEEVFDQQALDCVPADKSTTKCGESGQYFSSSNQVLRSAIATSHYENQHSNATLSADSSHSEVTSAPPSDNVASGDSSPSTDASKSETKAAEAQ